MVAMFIAYIIVRCMLDPAAGPPADKATTDIALRLKLKVTAQAIVPAAALVAAVLGAILFGIASPTEAAATGALGALMLAAAHGKLDRALVKEALPDETASVTAMILTIVFGGTLFASVFYVHGGGALIAGLLGNGAIGANGLVFLLLAIVFALGFVLDWATIICVPVFAPLLKAAGVDPLWFGVLMLVCIQTSYLTPPMAPAIFYLQSVAPPEMTYADICRGVIPFVACQAVTLVLVFLWPALATWLPEVLRAY